MMTKLISKPEKLLNRKERIQLAKQINRIKHVNPPDEKEQEILDLLWQNYNESDTAAKAAARFEADVHKKIADERIASGMSEDDAGDVGRVFSASEFNNVFSKLMKLKVELALIERLGLNEFKKEIMERRINSIFGHSDKNSTIRDKLLVGSPEAQLLMRIKNKYYHRE